MKGHPGTESDLLRDFLSILLDKGYGLETGECANQKVGIGIIFAFIGVKYRDGGDLCLILCVEVHGFKYIGYKNFPRVHVGGVRGFPEIFED